MDLNVLASNAIAEGDVDALKRWVEYSLQPEKILQVIFDEKRYECLPPVLPFLSTLFVNDKRHLLGVDILFDLLERKESLPQLKNIDSDFFLKKIVERKLILNFEQNMPFSVEGYYNAIIQYDCIELFTLLREEILETIGDRDFYQFVADYVAVQIFEVVPLPAEYFPHYFDTLLFGYTQARRCGEQLEKNGRMLRRILQDSSLQEEVREASYELVQFYDPEELVSLVRLGYQMSEEQKEYIQTRKPELYSQLFGEDV